jgi:FkbM family methyltransferase
MTYTDFAPDHWNNPAKGAAMRQRWDRFWNLYDEDGWEPETKALVTAALEPGDLFLDIGAWIGPVTLWALGCGAEVIAIEPDQVALTELRRVVPEDVEIHECALGLEHGTAKLAAASAYGDSMSKLEKDGIPVPMRTLPEILDGRRPAMAVMDIEGYEMTLLPEVAPYLASLGTTLVVALHTGVPPRSWFAGFREVTIPKTARRGGNARGRSLAVIARP